jgi:hypothetical protein
MNYEKGVGEEHGNRGKALQLFKCDFFGTRKAVFMNVIIVLVLGTTIKYLLTTNGFFRGPLTPPFPNKILLFGAR